MMKNYVISRGPMGRRWLGMAVLMLGLGLMTAVQAQTRIGTLDLTKVFDGYYRTKQADTQLKERAGDFEKARQGMVTDFETAKTEFEKLRDSASDQALSAEERDRRKASAEKKLLEIRQIEQDVAQFDRTSRGTLAEQQRRMRDRILDEIKEVVATKAKASAFDLVLDVKGLSAAETPLVLYSSGTNDLTTVVLSELNSRGPVDLPPVSSDK